MITKKVNRYYCEYCKKQSGASWAMKKHEERCTLNPNRHCGYCDLLEEESLKIADLMAILPDPKEYEGFDNTDYNGFGLDKAVDAVLPKLREAANNCPACIMAALRQKGIPVPVAENFHFKEECQSIWNDFNYANQERDY